MKSDNAIGVAFGLLSWGTLFVVLIWSYRPPSNCPYCNGAYFAQRGSEQTERGLLPAPAFGHRGSAESPDLQAYNTEHNEYHRLRAASEYRGIEPNWWQAFIALGACVVAIVQAALFVVQLRKMDASLTDAKDTSKAELRAYVSASMKDISRFDTKRAPIFLFECINHGKTPAKDIEFRAAMGVVEEGATEFPPLDIVPWNARRMNLFPNANETSEDRGEIPCNCGRIFTRQEIDQIRAGTHFMFIGLEIQYWDFITDTNHFTRNYYRLGGHPVALRLLTIEGDEAIEITGLSDKDKSPRFSIIPGLSLVT